MKVKIFDHKKDELKVLDWDDLFILNWWEKIYFPCYRFVRDIENFFRYDIPQGVGNLISYFPIIWRDRDWDHCFLAAMLEKKLYRMQKIFERGHHVNALRDAKRLKICVELCRRIQHNDPGMEYFKIGYNTGKSRSWHRAMDKRASQIQSYYSEYLGHLMGKYFYSWWD